MSTELNYGMTDDAFARLAALSWQLKALGQAQQVDELPEEAKERLGELVERLANEITLITGEEIHQLRSLRAV